MTRLAEAPDQDIVTCLQEDDPGFDPTSLKGTPHRGQGERGIARPYVEDDGDLSESSHIRCDEIGQVRQ